jgi:hypothetical protein
MPYIALVEAKKEYSENVVFSTPSFSLIPIECGTRLSNYKEVKIPPLEPRSVD